MWLDWHKTLIASGVVDGTFLDKPSIFAFEKGDNWYICECGKGPCGNHSWSQACGIISPEDGKQYNVGKNKLLMSAVELYRPIGGFVIATRSGTGTYSPRAELEPAKTLINQMSDMKSDPNTDYIWVPSAD